MSSTLRLTIVTLDRQLYDGDVYAVSMPTPMGEITVLPHHIPLVTAVTPGEIRVRVEEGKGIFSADEIFIAVGSGVAEISNNTIRLLTDSAERVDEIDEKRALEAKERAEKRILELREKQRAGEDVALVDATASLARHLARLKVLERKKRHHRG